MKETKALLKINKDQTLVEITNDNGTIQYCVCSCYDESLPIGSRWCWGHYFPTLEGAIKYAALRCYTLIRRYVLVEVDSSCNINEKVYSNYDDAYEEFKKRFDDYSLYEDCFHAEIVDDGNGNTVGQLWFDDAEDIELKIIKVIV